MVLVAAGVLIAYLVTFFLMPFIIKVAKVNKLYDRPDERKTHNHLISSLGGVGIFAGLAVSLLLVSDFSANNGEIQYHLAAFFIIFIFGVIDDIFVLGAWKKVLGQFFVAAILTLKARLLITNLYGFAGLNDLSSTASYLLSFFTVLLVINAFNLLDGVDGLAASVGLVSCVTFGLFFLINNNILYAILGFAMSGALLAFLIFNFPPAKIFMGDSGSMLLGLVNAVLLIKFIQTGSSVTAFPVQSAPAIGFGILLLPLMDVLRVFIIRLTKGTSPFAPDRSHIHHLLLNKGFSHTQVTLFLMLVSAGIAGLGFVFQWININVLIASACFIFFGGIFIIKYFIPNAALLHVVTNDGISENQNVKVLPIYGTPGSSAISEE